MCKMCSVAQSWSQTAKKHQCVRVQNYFYVNLVKVTFEGDSETWLRTQGKKKHSWPPRMMLNVLSWFLR